MKLPVTDEYLLRYLNGELEPREALQLGELLEQAPGLNTRLEELRIIQTYLKQANHPQQPGINFTSRVMSGLDRVKAQTLSARRGLILLIGSIVASGIALGLLTLGAFDSSTSLLIEPPVQNTLINLPEISVPFNTKLLVNTIIFLNLGLAFVLLDRTILRPLFQNRAAGS
ncbi:MAG: hypothetical protein KIT62_10960 [Cyclobacteriaceae bacterium]|nr:hypothetical protein [Cyclobacteriaceae bacterium]